MKNDTIKKWLGRKEFEDQYNNPPNKKYAESHVDDQGNIFTKTDIMKGNCRTIIKKKNGIEIYRDTTYYDFDNKSSISNKSDSNNSALMGAFLGFTIGRSI